MKEEIKGGVKVAAKKEIACIFCGKTDNLAMHPHKKGGKVVGFIYSCCEIKPRNRIVLQEDQE